MEEWGEENEQRGVWTYVGEHGGDVEAAGALDIHEVAVGALDQALELVLAGLSLGVGVKEILALLHQYKGAH
jgi:hypothetical protein